MALSIDESIDRCFRSWTRSILPWLLACFHYITEKWDEVSKWSVKTRKAIEYAHKDDVWIFFDANHRPYHAKSDWPGIPDNALVFNPKTNLFLLHNRLIPSPRINRFDFITAEIKLNEKMIDCSDFFLEIGWKGLAIPSLVEMVHLYSIQKLEKPFTVEQINVIVLHVTDIEGDTFEIPLNSSFAKSRNTSLPSEFRKDV